jgi:hypothetical protein
MLKVVAGLVVCRPLVKRKFAPFICNCAGGVAVKMAPAQDGKE